VATVGERRSKGRNGSPPLEGDWRRSPASVLGAPRVILESFDVVVPA
jgi:hypothetical protein